VSNENFILTAQETLEGKILEAQTHLAEAIKRDDGTMIGHWEYYIRVCEKFLKTDPPSPAGN